MTSSSLSVLSATAPIVARRSVMRLRLPQSVGVLMATALVTGAFVLAPEQPQQQASICERHHSAAVCRVW